MIRILIVDDEALVRIGLQSMINWESLGMEIIGQATNGEEALHIIEEKKPELIITDIKMPVLDGISMLKQLDKNYMGICIVLSGHDEFELVREALKLQIVHDYILKINLNTTALKKILEECRNKIQQISILEKKTSVHNNFIHKRWFNEWKEHQFSTVPNVYKEEKKELSTLHYIIIKTELSKGLNKESHKIRYMLNGIEELYSKFKYHCIALKSNVIVQWVADVNDDSFKNIHECIKREKSMINQYFNLDAIMGYSSIYQGKEKILPAYFEAKKVIDYKFVHSDELSSNYKRLEEKIKNTSHVEIRDLQSKLAYGILNRNEEAFKLVIKDLLYRIETSNSKENIYEICMKFVYMLSMLAIVEIDELLYKDLGDNYTLYTTVIKFKTIDEVKEWIEAIEEGILIWMKKPIKNLSHATVIKAENYIKNNLSKKVSLSQVARELEISEGYLSTVFKKITGKSFTDYVLDMKVNLAQELLKTGEWKVYEVSHHIGMDDPYYFSKVFKKITQMTPSEYILRSMNQEES